MNVTTSAVRRAALAAAETLIGHSEELCALDSVAGDGDHGLAMAAAARGVIARLDADPGLDGVELLSAVGEEVSKVGGSMGALLFVAADAAAAAASAAAGQPEGAVVALMLAAAQEQISELGGAAPGDKTILDAVDPAREAACAAVDSSLAVCLRRAAAAARAGAQDTTTMAARAGRASRLGDISLGSADAGATSFSLILEAVASVYEGDVV